jgi:hypothetical protein
LAVNGHDNNALKGEPENAGAEHGHQHGEAERGEIEQQRVGLDPAGQRQQRRHGEIGAHRDKGAMAKIEDIHQAEHQGQAAGDHKDHGAHGEGGDGQRYPGAQRTRPATA